MRKEWSFITLMTIGGALAGFSLAVFFIRLINPGLPAHLLTLSEKHDAEILASISEWTADYFYFILAGLAVIVFLGFVLLIINFNNHVKKELFKDKTITLRFLAVVLVEALLFYLLFAAGIFQPMENLLKIYGSGKTATDILIGKYTAMFLAGGLVWLIAGERGWAGDFSSWKIRVRGRTRELSTCFLLGGLVGLAGFLLYMMNDWVFRKYYILVSEVLDKSDEVSSRGIRLITYELMLMISLSLGILAGLVVALAPVYRDTKTRLRWLIFPGVLSLIAGVVVLPTYFHAVSKYDLGKKDLAEATGIYQEVPNKTVLFMGADNTVVVQKWLLEAEYHSLAKGNSIAVSSKNLEMIEQYLDQHKDGSVFQYAAEEALFRGYVALWDTDRALEQQVAGAKRMLLLRMMLLPKMSYLPVTSKNLSYLMRFTDEAQWYAGADAALQMAEAFIHFDRFKDARQWLEKAKERGANPSDIARINVPEQPVLKTGTIFGKITVNGKPPSGARVALLQGSFDTHSFTPLELARRILDARKLSKDGDFTFQNLGEGAYSLAIMVDNTTVPITVAPTQITIPDMPPVIRLSKIFPQAEMDTLNIQF